MKQLNFLTLSLSLSLFTALSANAQLKVLANGNVEVGTKPTFGNNAIIPGTGTLVIQNFNPDTVPTLTLFGNNMAASGAKLCFGTRGDVFVGETKMQDKLREGVLSLGGKGGIVYKSGTSTIFQYNPQATIFSDMSVFRFSVDVKAPQYLTTSDERMKSNILSLENQGSMLESLTPVSYILNTAASDGSGTMEKNSPAAGQGNPNRQFGFLAQEVREIYPELVFEDEDGMLSIDYNGFIPLLVDAYKNLTIKVEEQEKIIAQLSSPSRKTRSEAVIDEMDATTGFSLSQNKPNPFKDTTEIRCSLPESVGTSFIFVYDLNGSQKMRLNIDGRGETVVSISGSTLTPGLYIYSLIADGVEIDSKRMIITD